MCSLKDVTLQFLSHISLQKQMEILDWRHSAAGASRINALQSYTALRPLPSHEPHTRPSLIRVPLSMESFILPRPSLLFCDRLATLATLSFIFQSIGPS